MREGLLVLFVLVAAIGLLPLSAPAAPAIPAAPKPMVDVRATLKGEVLADELAKPGDDVSEGTPLVYVRTQTGRAVAARATVDGRVVEVLVRPGMVIRELGFVVVRIDPK